MWQDPNSGEAGGVALWLLPGMGQCVQARFQQDGAACLGTYGSSYRLTSEICQTFSCADVHVIELC